MHQLVAGQPGSQVRQAPRSIGQDAEDGQELEVVSQITWLEKLGEQTRYLPTGTRVRVVSHEASARQMPYCTLETVGNPPTGLPKTKLDNWPSGQFKKV
jgi:hypothetical protein